MLRFFSPKPTFTVFPTVYKHTVWSKLELSVSFQGHSDDGKQFNKHQSQCLNLNNQLGSSTIMRSHSHKDQTKMSLIEFQAPQFYRVKRSSEDRRTFNIQLGRSEI